MWQGMHGHEHSWRTKTPTTIEATTLLVYLTLCPGMDEACGGEEEGGGGGETVLTLYKTPTGLYPALLPEARKDPPAFSWCNLMAVTP